MRRWAACVGALCLAGRPAGATPLDFLPAGDPIESELRLLDLYSSATLGERLRLPHLASRPLQLAELQGPGAPPVNIPPAVALSMARVERVLGRDPLPGFMVDVAHRPTRRLFADDAAVDQRLEVSTGIEGRGTADEHVSRLVSGSGLHARVALAVDRWLAYSHLVAGRFDQARTFADPLVAGSDFIIYSEESYLALTGASGRWSAQFGRSRWHWGPGEEGSLLLSRSSAALTGLAFHARFPARRLDLTALSATLDAAAGEQLAAHRLEWQPRDGLRLGVAEAARYHASGWSPLYLVPVIPYMIVQRMQVQDEPGSLGALRNNILVAVDAGWRIADGTRVYGEVLVDDLHAKSNDNPDKLAWQLGWEGAGMIGRQRLSWGGEITRVWRFVYTSYFGRGYEAQDRPLGFPTGPDSRRVRLRVSWDPDADWQGFLRVTQSHRGESGLDSTYVPGTPRPDPGSFLGTVERTRDVELGMRWWPAGGVDVAVSGGYRWVENLAHLPGARDRGPQGSLALRLTR